MTDQTQPAQPGDAHNPIVAKFEPVTLTPRKVQRYGWNPDLPDHRDHIFNLKNKILKPGQVAPTCDLTAGMPTPYDQLNLGSCTGNGWAGVMEYREAQQGETSGTPSRLFIYQNELIADGCFGQDNGAQIRDGAKVVANLGVPPESVWPYDLSQFTVKPPDSVYQQAKKYEALAYERILVGGPGAPMRTAISMGLPIVFGMPVPDYFEQGWDPATQPLPVPGPNANIIGGHCMVVVGYDFSLQRFRVPVFKVRNSWGPSWGEAGYCYLDYRWFAADQSLASDMWVVQKVS